jgi:type IV secretory pathway TraG/TraD family ATPase VirD4
MSTEQQDGPEFPWGAILGGLAVAGIAILAAPIAVIAVLAALLVRRGVRARWLLAGAGVCAITSVAILGSGAWGDYGRAYSHLSAETAGTLAGALPVALVAGLLGGLVLAGAWAWHGFHRGRPWARHVHAPPRRLYHAIHRAHRGDIPHAVSGLRPGALPAPPPTLVGTASAPLPPKPGEIGQSRLFAGGVPGRAGSGVWAQLHMAVLAPTGRGKTVSVVIPNLLRWGGPCLVTSTKLDVVADPQHGTSTWAWRRRMGPCWVFDPSGAAAKKGYASIRWSPLWCVTDWSGAVRLASVIADAAGINDPAGQDKAFFSVTAKEILGPYLLAAVRGQRDLATVYRWLQGWTATEVRAEIVKLLENDKAALGALVASGSKESTADTLANARRFLSPWQDPDVAAMTARSEWTPDDLLLRRGTLYVLSLRREDRERLRNVYTLLVVDILARAKELQSTWSERMATTPQREREPFALLGALLDETANVAPIPGLDDLISECREYARILTVWQSLAKMRERYGETGAQSILANSGAQVWFAPDDYHTAQALSDTLSTENVWQTTTTPSPVPGAPPTKSRQQLTRPRASVGDLMSMRDLVLTGGGHQACLIEPRPYYASPELVRRSRLAPPDGDNWTPDSPPPDEPEYGPGIDLPGTLDGAVTESVGGGIRM